MPTLGDGIERKTAHPGTAHLSTANFPQHHWSARYPQISREHPIALTSPPRLSYMNTNDRLHHAVNKLKALGGAISAFNAREYFSRGELRLLARNIHHERATYYLPHTPPDVVTSARYRLPLGCISLLHQEGFPYCTSHVKRTHLTVHPQFSLSPSNVRTGKDVRFHRCPNPGDDKQTRLVQALIHAARCLPFRELVALYSWCLSKRRHLARQVREYAAEHPRSRVALAMRYANERYGSIAEVEAGILLRRARLPHICNPEMPGRRRVDFLVSRRIIVEIDGYTYHHQRPQFSTDRQRDRTWQQWGLPVLRFTAEELADGAGFIADIRKQLSCSVPRKKRQVAAAEALVYAGGVEWEEADWYAASDEIA